MSCHLSHRLTTVHRAVSMALLCSISYAALVSSAQAATIGKTVVTSSQHEPLAASIMVTNIHAADFSASLANSHIYQQMGLTPTDSMTVRFKPTSATSGQVFITTSQPVSKPFADVVLAINDKGQRNVVPKTLLMPLSDGIPIDGVPIKTAKNIVTGAKKPNLPSVSANNDQPLTVRKGTPPPLISSLKTSEPKISAPQSSTELLASKLPAPNIQAPTVTSTLQGNNLTYAPSRLDNGRLNNDRLNNGFEVKNTANNSDANGSKRSSASRLDNGRLSKNTSNAVMTADASNLDISSAKNVSNDVANDVKNNKNVADNKAASSKALIAAENPDKSFDTLNIEIIRQIQPSDKTDASASITAASPLTPTPNNDVLDTSNANSEVSNTATSATSSGNIPANTSPKLNNNNSTTAVTATSNSAAQYQVQRNDSLWVIAQQIAKENNLDIQTVMKQIQTQNPGAFINKDAGQLKADAKLSLPSYDVVPSQQNLEAAISAQKQYSRRANTPVIKKTTKTPPKTAQATKRPKKPKITKTQTLPKAQFSLLAPGRNGSADGTQEKSASATGNGLSTDILATLKASRKNTASQAQQLSKISSALDSYTKKIQLQNQKLAELQARLEKLRNQ
ncbi:MAG: peptigoglycan-binding protein LysM [Psychrobacter sp.]|nr:peptigoglycan-binding protein LysM [Psychrobacter sp.]